MNHQEVIELLPWYVNGTLGTGERQAVRQHLRKCFQCRAELREWEEIGSALEDLKEEAPRPSPGLPRRLLDQIQAEGGAGLETAPSADKPAAKPWWRSETVFRIAAVLLLLVVSYQNLQYRRQLDQAAQPQVLPPVQVSAEIRGVTTVELPQGERWLYLQVEIPAISWDRSYRQFRYRLMPPQGGQPLFSGTAPVGERLDLFLPAGRLDSGRYTLVVLGEPQDEGLAEEISAYTVDLQRK